MRVNELQPLLSFYALWTFPCSTLGRIPGSGLGRMSANNVSNEAEARRRFWLWLLAALLAIAFLLAVLRWTAPSPGTPLPSTLVASAGGQIERSEPATEKGEWL